MARFGSNARGLLFIQLSPIQSHYLTVVITDKGFRFALITLSNSSEGPNSFSVMKDFGWIDLTRMPLAANRIVSAMAIATENHILPPFSSLPKTDLASHSTVG